jgi:bifunctional DNA-binding transcriptional regulator/antitoxin component of YhaV-PrlF toxin-antitoxin module
VIPADLRKKYKLHAGVRVSVVDYGDEIAFVVAMANPAKEAAGMLRGRTSLTGALMAERARIE